jgi:hypothetical protein
MNSAVLVILFIAVIGAIIAGEFLAKKMGIKPSKPSRPGSGNPDDKKFEKRK